MSNEKKNPLIGAFRAPPVGTPPSPTQPAKQPETPKNVKAPATPLSAPILTKLEESKKTVEPAKDDKAVKDGKPAAPRFHVYFPVDLTCDAPRSTR